MALLPFLSLNLSAQETRFFMPSEIVQAYESGSRSLDGNPGLGYWQNSVDYDIEVEIVPSELMIIGHEKVIYYNNSPHSLTKIVLNIYADAYKIGNTRLFAVDRKFIDDGSQLSDLLINDVKYDLDNTRKCKRKGTQLSITLEKSLEPGQNLSLEISWKQQIQSYDGRAGIYDSTSFFIGYFYPQVAVYDDVFGWDNLPWTIENEFYNNLANFNVNITAPPEFVVWATGTLNNPKEVFPKGIYSKYKEAKASSEVVNIISYEDIKRGIIVNKNTWHYTAKEVSDYSFALSDHFAWDASNLQIDNRNILVSSVHQVDSTYNYAENVIVAKKALKVLSEESPAIPYPYEAFTTVISKGIKGNWGMEYPMMTTMSYPSDGTTIHEIFHTYFPMYVRTNEKKWAWMDEGWADYYTDMLEYRYLNEKDEDINILTKIYSSSQMGSTYDLPLFTSSEFLTKNAGYLSYNLPSIVYTILHQYLGDEMFHSCIQEYIQRWAKKSPTPYDFYYTFETISGEDLSWLWKPWFFEFGVPDIAIESFNNGEVVVRKIGVKPVPLLLEVNYNDGRKIQINRNAKVWIENENYLTIKIEDPEKVMSINANLDLPEANELDNIYPPLAERYTWINFDRYLGKYTYQTFKGEFEILEKDGKLYVKSSGDEYDLMIPKYEGSFLCDGYDMTFEMDESGQIEYSFFSGKWKAKKQSK